MTYMLTSVDVFYLIMFVLFYTKVTIMNKKEKKLSLMSVWLSQSFRLTFCTKKPGFGEHQRDPLVLNNAAYDPPSRVHIFTHIPHIPSYPFF